MIVVYSIAVMVVAETKIHNIEKSTSCCRPIFAFFIFFLLSFQTPKIEQWCAFNEYGLWNESKAWSTSFVLQMSICTPRQMILCVVLSLPCLAGVLSICNERLVLTRTWTGACVVMKQCECHLIHQPKPTAASVMLGQVGHFWIASMDFGQGETNFGEISKQFSWRNRTLGEF